MILLDEKEYPSVQVLVQNRIASRIHAKDDTVYDFDENAQDFARRFMGWADLASNPPYEIEKIQAFADKVIEDGFRTVVLIGQGGSTQAPMTITKYNKADHNRVEFKTIDSDSPVRVREIIGEADLSHTIVVVASKSGGTLEPRLMLSAVLDVMSKQLPAQDIPNHLVAITDPGSDLEKRALAEGWRGVLPGKPDVGGRYSAMSVFGLLPAALVGIDIASVIARSKKAELACSADEADNPAIQLAAFLFDNYQRGRDKFCFLTPRRGRVLGLWIEQLVAESLGKQGVGILPNIEVDPLLLSDDAGDRTVIEYETKTDLKDEQMNFKRGMSYLDPAIPIMHYKVNDVDELSDTFIMWEYAVAMCGYLLKVCPFDQPDVASAKAVVLEILQKGKPAPHLVQKGFARVREGEVEVRVAPRFSGSTDLRSALWALFASIQPGDYFSLNAFLPFTGEHRRESLDHIRHEVAETMGVVSCLEVGPRYLHSTGQMHKGGPNNGVFLVLSADELEDIELGAEAKSLGDLAKAQAIGDAQTLAQRDRRVVHVHLSDNSGVTLRAFAELVAEILAEL